LILIASIPTAVIGIVFQDAFEALFESVLAVGIAWLVMGVLLVASRKFSEGGRELSSLNQRDAFLIGTAQGIAIIPGVSRSGLTILAAMLCGVEKKEAARFSFLIAFPAILGAGMLKFKEGIEFVEGGIGMMAVGFVSSAIVGLLAIAILLKLIQQGKFYVFGYYCIALSLATLVYALFSGSAQ